MKKKEINNMSLIDAMTIVKVYQLIKVDFNTTDTEVKTAARNFMRKQYKSMVKH